MDTRNYRFETRQIHAGLQPDEPTGSRGMHRDVPTENVVILDVIRD